MRPRQGKRKRSVLDVATTSSVVAPIVHSYTRMYKLGDIVAGPADGGSGRSFTLSSLPNSSEFTSLYNQYRITQIDLIYEFSTHILPSSKAYPRLTFCVDYNDASNPSAESELLQYETAEVFQFGQVKHTFKRSFKPRVALAAYQGTFSGYTTAPESMWLNCDNTSIQYYGIKEWVSNYNTVLASGATLTVYARYYMDFKAVR